MSTPASSLTHQSTAAAPAVAGVWKLAARRAVSLRPREHGILHVAAGRLWVTLDVPGGGRPADSGDHVLSAGERLPLRPGSRVVLEAWERDQPAAFDWVPAPAALALASPGWAGVREPLADLRLALVQAGVALGRLLWALARVGAGSVSRLAGRRRPQPAGCPGR